VFGIHVIGNKMKWSIFYAPPCLWWWLVWCQVVAWSDRRKRVVVFYAHHHIDVHGQPGRVSDRRTHADADRERRRPLETDLHPVRHARRRLHQGVLQSNPRLEILTLYSAKAVIVPHRIVLVHWPFMGGLLGLHVVVQRGENWEHFELSLVKSDARCNLCASRRNNK